MVCLDTQRFVRILKVFKFAHYCWNYELVLILKTIIDELFGKDTAGIGIIFNKKKRVEFSRLENHTNNEVQRHPAIINFS